MSVLDLDERVSKLAPTHPLTGVIEEHARAWAHHSDAHANAEMERLRTLVASHASVLNAEITAHRAALRKVNNLEGKLATLQLQYDLLRREVLP